MNNPKSYYFQSEDWISIIYGVVNEEGRPLGEMLWRPEYGSAQLPSKPEYHCVADVRALTGLKGLRAGQLVAFYLISICPAQCGG